MFPDLRINTGEHRNEQVVEQRVTGGVTGVEQDNLRLMQEVEHLKTLVLSQQSHIDSLKQAMLLIEHKQQSEQVNAEPVAPTIQRSRWAFWRK